MLKDTNPHILDKKPLPPVEVGKELLEEKQKELDEISKRYEGQKELQKHIQEEKNVI